MSARDTAPIDIAAFAATGESVPIPLTEVKHFEPGHGRPDLEVLHRAIEMLDSEASTTYEVREMIANHVNQRESA